ncbi:hypothetical protein Cgig2_032907 [Carnegiea gigantea]|uniref:Uncharacterized protein n=1 Tax=Carnegiea gigantea TaxID=171969 RepID=A0A9Q1GLM6_9CARY|nr:hypothetical protein Cgig2_032907 [Carnegiea gigantea]
MHGPRLCDNIWSGLWMIWSGGFVTLFHRSSSMGIASSFRQQLLNVWFYGHTTQFDAYERPTFPRIMSWSKVYHGCRFDVFELVIKIKEREEEEREEPIVRDFMETDEFQCYVKDAERLHRVRDCLHLERDEHAITRAELDLCRARVLKLEAMLHNVADEQKRESLRQQMLKLRETSTKIQQRKWILWALIQGKFMTMLLGQIQPQGCAKLECM